MKKQLFIWSLICVLFLGMIGCGNKKEEPAKPETATPSQDNKEAASSTNDSASYDANSPEGVTNQFFEAFFTGNDSAAFALLTPKAQEVTQETFSAEASDTIKWKVTKKRIENGIASVVIDVEDLNDQGEYAKEELVFALKNCQDNWRVAGFTAGNLIVNFEQKLADASDDSQEAPVRVGQTESEGNVR
ncbi:MAG: hypothetical protein Q4C95_12230 [Planctomycetia bacterium]|nr:hypothetical protein [Planctomycetia bacterium]